MRRTVGSSPSPSIIASSCALLLLASCGADVERRDDEPLAREVAPNARPPADDDGEPLVSLSFDADGLTQPVSVPAFAGESLVLRAKTEPDTCFAIASMNDAAGRVWASQREAGPYCADCAVRTSVAKREAFFVLSKDGDFDPTAGLTLHFGMVRCDTLTPLRSATGQRVELSWLPRATIPARGRVALRFVVSEHSMLRGRPDLQRELVTRLNGELAETGLEVSLDDVTESADIAPEARFSTTDLAELEAMLDGLRPAPMTADVVFAGCLRFDDVLRPPTAVDGFTPRVLGGVGPAPAIFMPGRRCDGFSEAPAAFPVETYAHTLAHELGHFLGVYHAVEANGSTDLLGDTSEANIMNHNPSVAIAQGFSPRQARDMRAHPWVQPLDANTTSAKLP